MSRLAQRLRGMERRLHIDHRGRSEWIWLVPALTFLIVVGVVVFVGYMSTLPVALYAPIAVIIATVITSMSIGYVTPDTDYLGRDGGSDEQRTRPAAPAPPQPAPAAPPRQRAPGWYGRLNEAGADERVPDRSDAARNDRST